MSKFEHIYWALRRTEDDFPSCTKPFTDICDEEAPLDIHYYYHTMEFDDVKSDYEKFAEDPENAKLLRLAGLSLDITEKLCEMMELRGVTKKELAERLGRTQACVTHFLTGRDMPTLRTVVRMFDALDCDVEVVVTPRPQKRIRRKKPLK